MMAHSSLHHRLQELKNLPVRMWRDLVAYAVSHADGAPRPLILVGRDSVSGEAALCEKLCPACSAFPGAMLVVPHSPKVVAFHDRLEVGGDYQPEGRVQVTRRDPPANTRGALLLSLAPAQRHN